MKRKTTIHLASLVLVSLLSSCAIIPYATKISLEPCEKTINKTVKIEKLVDLSPKDDKKIKLSRVSITDSDHFQSDLSTEITDNIVVDFSTNGLFGKVSRTIDDPDFVMKGEIKKFSGFKRANKFTNVSSIFYLGSIITAFITHEPIILVGALPFLSVYAGIPTGEITAEVDIIIRLYDRNNNIVGTYKGKSKNKKITSVYKNRGDLPWQKLMNQTYSEAINKIRDQIIQDKDKLENYLIPNQTK